MELSNARRPNNKTSDPQASNSSQHIFDQLCAHQSGHTPLHHYEKEKLCIASGGLMNAVNTSIHLGQNFVSRHKNSFDTLYIS